MQISEAAKLCLEYHKCHSKEHSIRVYRLIFTQLCDEFGSENLEDITTEVHVHGYVYGYKFINCGIDFVTSHSKILLRFFDLCG